MYWGQVALSLVVALLSAHVALQQSLTTLEAALVGLVAYVATRWAIAWMYRVRYWYQRGTRSIYHDWCPNCSSRRYRKGGDWLLTCHRCGWQPGVPILRWVTRSVPSRQLSRTVVGPRLVLVIVAVALLSSGALAGVGADIGNASGPNATPVATESPSETTPVDRSDLIVSTHTQALEVTDTPSESVDFNETRVEELIFEFLNERRAERDMEDLAHNSRAAEAARIHADDMAENGYFNHTSLDGETQEERYSFCSGGENAAYTWVNRDVITTYATRHYDTERELASGIVEMWMHSDPHRERGIYGEWWIAGGAGVSITADGKAYAVFGFCSD